MVITIDGPAGTGKSSVARAVAERLGFDFLDTGAMYRAIGLAATRKGIDVKNDEPSLADLASSSQIEFIPGEPPHVLLDGEDVTGLIRTNEISMAASHVSAFPVIRRLLVKLQQDLGRKSGGVLEGRDIGTKVFPETPHKFFLTARPEVRAERRHRELQAKGTDVPLETILAETKQRDEQDSSRAESPLTYDDSYTVIDTSDMTIEEVVQAIVGSVRG
jgi:cytidylate kinase